MSLYFYYWGCQIQARLPFIENTTRRVVLHLNKTIDDIQGFTCCPESALVKAMGNDIWRLAAARNLALAESYHPDGVLVTPCNGCSGTLKSVRAILLSSPQIKESINEQLRDTGLRFKGGIKVRHLVEYFHTDVGISAIKAHVRKPLTGLRLAVHTGCHFSRPVHSGAFDAAFMPTKMDELLRALGAETPDYLTKEQCCGQEMARVDESDNSLHMMRTKLSDIQRHNCDALVVCCPACFMQFDQRQFLIQRQGERFNIPVFFITELMALSFGIDETELFLDEHKINVAQFVMTWKNNLERTNTVRDIVDHSLLKACRDCGACCNDCPAVLNCSEFDPATILKMLFENRLDEALRDGKFWLCLQCHTCSEMCPQNIGMEQFFEALREEALRRGILPRGIKNSAEMFEKKAMLADIQQRVRVKFGLPEVAGTASKDLLKLLKSRKG